MKREVKFWWRLALASVIFASAAIVVAAQTQKPNVVDTSCAGIDLEREQYSVRTSKISDPFKFLPWVKAREKRASTKIGALIDGKPFVYSAVNSEALKIIEDENFLPDTTETRLKLRLLVVRVSNCTNKAVDVTYGVYSTQLMPVLSGSPESRIQERKDPAKSAGLINVDVPDSHSYRFTPLFGYDSTDKLAVGGQFEFARKRGNSFISSGIIDGQASSQMHQVAARMKGFADDWKGLAHLEWNLEFDSFRLPTSSGKLKGGNLSAHIAGTTKPLGPGAIVLRFGGLIEGGNRQSDLTNAHLATDTVASSPYTGAKFFVGATTRFNHNALSASYGLQLGATARTVRVDWAKQIGDLHHEFWYSFGEHRAIDVESRLNFGKITTYEKIPLAERFFGGSNEQDFIALDNWEVRANPVIRSIPGSSFFRTPNGDGGNKFFSYNLTAAFSIWRKPLVPTELSRDKEFEDLLQGQLVSAEEFEKLYFLTKDPHFAATAEFIKKPDGAPQLQSSLTSLTNAVNSAQAAQQGQHPTEFRQCTSALRRATSRATSGETAKGEQLYGYVASLLSADEDLLTEVHSKCVTTLNGADMLNGDQAIATAGASVEKIRVTMESEFSKIDEAAATRKAKEDMAFARRTINTILYDVNLYSVSPVFVFDMARLSAKKAGLGGTRYGPGGGLRFELVSAVNFTGGYAWNVNRGPGEAKGTFFFSMGVRDLFR
ncbi:MAG TPA: hypothetical protein VI306_12445 [Pyrinomonadaceae bacterium]